MPITVSGKIISGIIAVLGIGLVALPTGMISAGFMEKLSSEDAENEKENDVVEEEKQSIKCSHCGKEIEG